MTDCLVFVVWYIIDEKGTFFVYKHNEYTFSFPSNNLYNMYFINQSIYLPMYLSICLSIYQCIYIPIYLPIYPSICIKCIYLTICLPICLSIYITIYLSIHCFNLSFPVVYYLFPSMPRTKYRNLYKLQYYFIKYEVEWNRKSKFKRNKTLKISLKSDNR